eukprot:SM000025S08451  [mRNA]  locus=s25:809975:812282:- [translate_table: standard]
MLLRGLGIGDPDIYYPKCAASDGPLVSPESVWASSGPYLRPWDFGSVLRLWVLGFLSDLLEAMGLRQCSGTQGLASWDFFIISIVGIRPVHEIGLVAPVDALRHFCSIFEGTWDCHSTLIAVDTPQGDEVADVRTVQQARKQLNTTTNYAAKFVPFGGYVIGDRLFTTTSLVEASVGPGYIKEGKWSPKSPNRLVLTLEGGLKVFDNSTRVNGPPSVKASRNLTRYRWDATARHVDNIEAFQRIAMYPLVGGAAGSNGQGLSSMDVLGLMMADKPTTVYKYIVRFTRRTT